MFIPMFIPMFILNVDSMRFQCVINVGEAGGWRDELFNQLPPARHRPYMSLYVCGHDNLFQWPLVRCPLDFTLINSISSALSL